MRIGFGYDSHRFEQGRKLVLGGVEIPFEKGLKGHSDADALIHAVIDAILGAAALGDIGGFFPDTDPQWKGADSAQLLKMAVKAVNNSGYRVSNIDATVICERPKLSPYVHDMRLRLSEILFADTPGGIDCVSVKGKTNEKMDAVGAGTGIEVHAVALLSKL